MHTLSLPYPDDLLVLSGKAPQALEEELSFLLAAKLFETHRLTLGKAADRHVMFQKETPEYVAEVFRRVLGCGAI